MDEETKVDTKVEVTGNDQHKEEEKTAAVRRTRSSSSSKNDENNVLPTKRKVDRIRVDDVVTFYGWAYLII